MEIQIGQSLAAGAIINAERCSTEEASSPAEYNACRSALNQAVAELRNDQLLLSRQARELSRQAALIGALEGALASLSSPNTSSSPAADRPHLEAPSATMKIESSEQQPPRQIGEPSARHVIVQKLEVLPTVYTNVGSLLDVFA